MVGRVEVSVGGEGWMCRQPLHWNDLDTTRAQGRDPIKLNTCYKTEHAYNHA